MARLGDICEILNGYAFKSEKYISSGIRVIRIANVQKGYIEDTAPAFYPIDTPDIEKYTLYEDDLLISLTGNVGRVALLKKEFLPAALNQRVACLRLKDGVPYNKSFLYCFLNSDYFENKCIQSAKGVAQKNMSTEWLKDYEIPDLSLEEQREIATALNKVSELITARTQQLSTFDNIVKSRFIEMFGDPVNNSEGLPELTLPELGEFGRGVSKHRPRNDPKLLGGKYPLIQTGEVANSNLYITEYESTYSELGFKQSKLWQKGTLCITIAANIAKTAILTFDACFPDSVVGFKANDKTNNIFIHYWFSFFQAILEAQAPESAQKNINLKTLSELKIIIPTIDLQNQFAEFVEQTDKLKFEVKEALEKLETLKKSLMQQYFG